MRRGVVSGDVDMCDACAKAPRPPLPPPRNARASVWIDFLEALQAEAPPERGHVAPRSYVVTCPFMRYNRVRLLGEGRHGRVYLYAVDRPEAAAAADLPAEFCVKAVLTDPTAELAAVRRLRRDGWTRGVVPAAELHGSWEGAAFVGMQRWAGSLLRLVEGGTLEPDAAADVAGQVARAVAALWRQGLAYTDIKCANVVFRPGPAAFPRVALADLGSAVDISTGQPGLFTYPPLRATFAEGADEDGVAAPVEADMVWGVALLLVCLLEGTGIANQAFSLPALAAVSPLVRCSVGEGLLEAVAARLEAAGAPSSAQCAEVVRLGMRAWRGEAQKPGCLRRLCGLLSGGI